MIRQFPPLAILLGGLGLLPFLGCGFLAVSLAEPDNAARALTALATYAAIILSFLGAVHWGIALEDDVGLADRARLGLGVLPALVGWLALMVFLAGFEAVALGILMLGFIGVIAVEQRGARRGLMPRRYLPLRWMLTVVVVLTLAIVLFGRLTGLHMAL